MALHKEILDTQNSKLPIIHPGRVANRLLDALQVFNLFNILRHSSWIMLEMALLILLMLCLFPVICQIGMYQLFKLKVDLHHVQLKKYKKEEMLGTKSHSLIRSLWLSSILTRSESAGAPCLYHGGKER
jgi:hypothetical protein